MSSETDKKKLYSIVVLVLILFFLAFGIGFYLVDDETSETKDTQINILYEGQTAQVEIIQNEKYDVFILENLTEDKETTISSEEGSKENIAVNDGDKIIVTGVDSGVEDIIAESIADLPDNTVQLESIDSSVDREANFNNVDLIGGTSQFGVSGNINQDLVVEITSDSDNSEVCLDTSGGEDLSNCQNNKISKQLDGSNITFDYIISDYGTYTFEGTLINENTDEELSTSNLEVIVIEK